MSKSKAKKIFNHYNLENIFVLFCYKATSQEV